MIAVGTKSGTRFAREIPAFTEPVELGLVVPMDDYKFLNVYKLLALDEDAASTVDEFDLSTTVLDSDDGYALSYVENLDGNYIANLIAGPATASSSKGIEQQRPYYRSSNLIKIDRDILKSADTLRMDMLEDDNLFVARFPNGWDFIRNAESIDYPMTIRTPQMANVQKHTNSLVFNMSNPNTYTLSLPMTGIGSISTENYYRFSFYYRLGGTGSLSINPIVRYYTNSGSYVSRSEWPRETITNPGHTETSDFVKFEFGIPKSGEKISDGTKRLKIELVFTMTNDPVFEMMYPVLEYAYNASAALGHMYLPDAPSSITYDRNYLNPLKESLIRTNVPSYNAKLFTTHIGRNIYDLKLDYTIIDATYLKQLRILEQFNQMGYLIALRPKHSDLPPVMIGNINIKNTHVNWKYYDNDISITFEEVL